MMQRFWMTLRPQTAFASPWQADMLFGQLCWAIRHAWGEAYLNDLLVGYTEGKPFLIVADPFPAGYVPLPTLPSVFWRGEATDPSQRKALKKKVWVPYAALSESLPTWQSHAVTDQDVNAVRMRYQQPHNSINRLTLCTGKDNGFAPYTVTQHSYLPDSVWSLYVLLDESRLSAERLLHVLEQVGQMGYGRDASSGLGKFTAEWLTPPPILSNTATPNAWLTLAPCAPQGGQWDAARSFYRPFTRYGRHGDMAAILGQPFKKPLLLAATGAVLSPLAEADWERGWVGQGLGGGGEGGVLSEVLSKTVHQGYAPALAVTLPVLH